MKVFLSISSEVNEIIIYDIVPESNFLFIMPDHGNTKNTIAIIKISDDVLI